MNDIGRREPVPVRILNITLYCEEFRATCIGNVDVQPTVMGESVISNSYRKGVWLKLKGRAYNGENALRVLTASNAAANVGINIDYGGVRFSNCYITSFSVEDKGENFIDISVSLFSQTSLIYSL